MKIEVTDVSPVRKNMAIEADATEVAQERKDVLRRYAQQARIPGFRPGKAPMKVIQARYAKELDEDLKERLVARLYSEAIREKDLRPLGDPALEDLSLEEGKPFRFTTSFEVVPVFTLKDYRDVEIRRPSVQVGPDEVSGTLEELREAHAKFVSEEGKAAETGDVIVADLHGTPEGGKAFQKERAMIMVGATDHLPRFNESLEGATAGSTLEFSVPYPDAYEREELAGKSVDYRLDVHEVKRREVPDLDDEFAKDMGDFESLDALRDRIREDLLKRKRLEAEQAVRQSVVDKVLLENAIPLPERLVEEEIRNRLEEMVRMMVSQGVDPRSEKLDWKRLREHQEDPARKSVHARLVLDAVAEAEGIGVENPEVDERLRTEAEKIGETYEKLRARLQKDHRLETFKIQMVREKSLDFLVSVANIHGEE